MDKELYQAQFILNALKDGWTVRMNSKGEYEFIKDKSSFTGATLEEVMKDGYSKQFLLNYTKNN